MQPDPLQDQRRRGRQTVRGRKISKGKAKLQRKDSTAPTKFEMLKRASLCNGHCGIWLHKKSQGERRLWHSSRLLSAEKIRSGERASFPPA